MALAVEWAVQVQSLKAGHGVLGKVAVIVNRDLAGEQPMM
jgi:hypothetical protein